MKIDRFIGPTKTPEQRIFFSLGLTTRAIPPERIILCWNRILKAFANSFDPDETPHNVA
ncbi:hypothetical protein DPMN_035199, partial [Dreissena polymorpha]